jgi:hypothetical protein
LHGAYPPATLVLRAQFVVKVVENYPVRLCYGLASAILRSCNGFDLRPADAVYLSDSVFEKLDEVLYHFEGRFVFQPPSLQHRIC